MFKFQREYSFHECSSSNHLSRLTISNPNCTIRHFYLHICINRQSGDNEINTKQQYSGWAENIHKKEYIFRPIRHLFQHEIVVYNVHHTMREHTDSRVRVNLIPAEQHNQCLRGSTFFCFHALQHNALMPRLCVHEQRATKTSQMK